MSKYNLNKILPHKPPMILIDDIKEVNLDEKTLTAIFRVYPEKLFYETGKGINSLCGIEFMAQTIGCYAYFRNNCKPPKLGFLLGSRLFNNALDVFKNGENYKIKVNEIFTDNQIVVFDCIMYDMHGEEIASATINVYQTDNVQEKKKKNE